MKKHWIILVMALFIAQPTFSEVGYGAKGGGEMYHLWDTDLNFSKVDLFFNGGVFLKFRFLDYFGISPEILFVKKGGSYTEQKRGLVWDIATKKDIPVSVTRITEYNNIEFPLLFRLYAPGFVSSSPNMFIGPYYGYKVGKRKISASVSGVLYSTPITKDTFVKLSDYTQEELDASTEPRDFDGLIDGALDKGIDNEHEFGLVIGGGIDFSLGTFDIRYHLGFTGVEKTKSSNRELDISKSGTLMVMVGFELGQ